MRPEHALAITAHVCDAPHYAHHHGIVHRDIKPANILLNQQGAVKVADLGLAKMNDPTNTLAVTQCGMTMGTPDCVAPEVLITGTVVDHRADLYAIGIMLYEMLTGKVPRGVFAMPSELVPGLDARFDAIVHRALQATTPALTTFALHNLPVTDEVVSHLAGLPKLSRLRISGAKSFTGKGLDQLASLPDLREISFVGTGFNGDAAKLLAGARKLEILNLENTAVTADGVAALGALTALRELVLRGCEKLDGSFLKSWPVMPALRELDLSKLTFARGLRMPAIQGFGQTGRERPGLDLGDD